jgi:hypothetical protein
MVSSKPRREGGTMKCGSRASPAIKIACPACDALPDEQCASDRYPAGRLGTFASEFRPERAAAAASAALALASASGLCTGRMEV